MPRCVYSCPTLDQKWGATFSTPKKITSLEAWLGSAVSALCGPHPSLPMRYKRKNVLLNAGWALSGDADVSPRSIAFTLVDSLGNRARLVIDRSFKEYGR